MDFFLFCLLNAVLFLRPAELVPVLLGLPIYQFVLLATVAASYPQMLKRLQLKELLNNPINFCVLGIVIAVPLSHIQHFNLYDARFSFLEFGKSAIYFLLFVSVVRTERRLQRFFGILVFLIAFMTSLSLLQHHEVIYLPALDSLEQAEADEATGEDLVIDRLQSTGIFNDPNDFAMILAVGVILSYQRLSDGDLLSKPFWLALIAAFLSLYLTKSRGGLLALFAACGAFSYLRWDWKRAVFAGLLLLPIAAAVLAMRDDGGMESGTGQSRIQLWSEGFALWKHSPLFGIGYGTYADEVGQVAHNSFVHCYVELGLLGGTMFFGCFFFALRTLWRQRKLPEIAGDRIAKRRTSLAMAIIVGVGTSMLSLSRAYGVPAYLFLGVGAVASRLNGREVPFTVPRFDYPTVRRLAIASVVFVVVTYIYIKTMVHWG